MCFVLLYSPLQHKQSYTNTASCNATLFMYSTKSACSSTSAIHASIAASLFQMSSLAALCSLYIAAIFNTMCVGCVVVLHSSAKPSSANSASILVLLGYIPGTLLVFALVVLIAFFTALFNVCIIYTFKLT